MLVAAPQIVPITMPRNTVGQFTYGSHSQLARELTDLWHQRFHSRWKVVAGATDVSAPMTFYSPDHPAPLTPNEVWSYELTPLDEAKRYGFIGICEVGAWDQQELRRLDEAECCNWRGDADHNAAILPRFGQLYDRLERIRRPSSQAQLEIVE
jgi:hypothetical protein